MLIRQRQAKVDRLDREPEVTPEPTTSPTISPPPPPTPPTPQFQSSIQEYDFVLERCTRESSDVVCWISVTNQGKGRDLKIYVDDSWLRDQDGRTHEVKRVLGTDYKEVMNIFTVDLPRGSTGQFGLRFEGAGGAAASVRFLKIHASGFRVELQ